MIDNNNDDENGKNETWLRLAKSHTKDLKQDISRMVMDAWGTSLERDYGGIKGFLEYYQVKEDVGPDPASIGERATRFGDGNLRLRENPHFVALLDTYQQQAAKDWSDYLKWLREGGEYAHAEEVMMKAKERKNDDEEIDRPPFYYMDSFLRMCDAAQTTHYEVLRGGKKYFVLGSELVCGDIVHLEYTDGKEDMIAERDARAEARAKQEEKEKNEPTKEPIRPRRDWSKNKVRRNREILRNMVPCDCLVLEGELSLNMVHMTGENMDFTRKRDDKPQVPFAGEILYGSEAWCLVIGVGYEGTIGASLIDLEITRREEAGRCKCVIC